MTGERRTGEALGGVLIALASIQFGMVVILGKFAQRTDLPTPTMLAVRFGTASVLLAIVIAAVRQPLAAAPKERLWLLGLGALGYAPESLFFFLALKHGTAAGVTLLFFTYPVLVAVVWMALGRGAPGKLVGGALVFAVGGAALVVGTSGSVTVRPVGVAWALGSAVMFTIYLLSLDSTVRRTSSLTGAMWVSGAASASLAIFAAATGDLEAPASAKVWWELVGMGAGTAGAFACLFAGLRLLGPIRTSIVAAAEPLATAVLGFLILDEPVRAGMAVGGALILVGAIVASLARAAPPQETSVP